MSPIEFLEPNFGFCAMINSSGPSPLLWSQRQCRGQQMRKKLGFLLILMLSTVSLSGCLFLRPVGPCYGVGCPALTSEQAARPGKAQASKAPAQKDPNKKSFFARVLPKWAQSPPGN
jgi:hypothetical protein